MRPVLSGRVKGVAAELLISIGVLALSLAAILSVGRRALLFPDAFSERLAGSLADPRVSSFVADRLTGAIVRQDPDLTGFRPLILGTINGAVSSSSFQAIVRATARAAHASLFSQGGRSVIVSVPDVGVLLKNALARTNPTLAAKVPSGVQVVLASIGQSKVDRVVLRLWRVARRSFWLAATLFLGGPLLAVVGVLAAANRRQGLVRLGLDLMVAGLVLFLLVPIGRAVVSMLPHDDLARRAAAGLWDAFTGSLRTWAYVFLGMGLVIQAAGRSLLDRLDLQASVRRFVGWIENPPGGARGRLLRGAGLLAGGAFALLRPADAVWFTSLLAGGVLASLGLREIFEIVLAAMPEPEESATTSAMSSAAQRVAVVVTLAAAFVAVIAFVGRPRGPVARPRTDACNGSRVLCGRRLDEVVFPATHNSMSAADIPDWLFPQQEKSIPGQLEDGIRALLFDVHYGFPVEGRVKTDLGPDPSMRQKIEKAVGSEGLAAAMRIRDHFTGKEEGPRGLYLCHGFCELGATPLATALRAVHEFMVESPGEVLVFVIEDYVSPQDLALAFREAGLDGIVYRGPVGPWPTLGEMIDQRQRVVVFTESGRPGVPWIHPAFEVMQETPYSFHNPSELSCVANRGGTSGSLFLMNNWIETTPVPKPSNAAIVNAYDALLGRARQCQAERGRLPNLIAVDFYRTGDLFRVVRTLNEPEGS
jgi:hypothetical protein